MVTNLERKTVAAMLRFQVLLLERVVPIILELRLEFEVIIAIDSIDVKRLVGRQRTAFVVIVIWF